MPEQKRRCGMCCSGLYLGKQRPRCDGQHRWLNITSAWLVGHSTGLWRC
ncbi:MAG: hypothetical protein MPI81_05425 [Synechococcus sp. H1_metabat_bins_2.tsv.006]|nr:hypothetical protein [Synechococcus sp. H1_metabat_bins_2.tsv.006]